MSRPTAWEGWGRSVRIPADSEAFRSAEVPRLALSQGTISLEVFDAALAEFVDLSREHDFLAAAAFTPSAHTVYEQWVVFEDPTIEEPLAGFSRMQREYFTRKSQELGFVFADGTPALQKAAAERRSDELLYFQWNPRYTPEGHQVFAREVAVAINSARP